MVESVGKKLHQARLQRGLTIDEAAHATKLRPDKIAALEGDDYSRFANNTYAKGFLQIYGRFLKVDVSDFARTLDNSNPISVSDYQYLSNAPAPVRESAPARGGERRPPSLAPLLFFIVLIGIGLAGLWAYTNYERIQAGATTTAQGAPERGPTPPDNSDAAFINDTLARVAVPTPIAIVTPSPALAAATPSPSPAPGATPIAAVPIPKTAPDRDFVSPSPVAATTPLAPGEVNEVLVATVKKTWVTVRKDDPKAPPIFEDYVYPNTNPLKLKGARFFIEARDPASVQITKNGLPYAYQPTGVPVQ